MGLVTNWKALPEEGLEREVGEGRGAIETNPKLGVVSMPKVAEPRFDQRNLVAPPPVGVASGDDDEEGATPEEWSLTGISFGGGTLTGETIAFGRSSCGPPDGMGTL